MVDRDLFPDPPEDGVLVPGPAHEVEARAREFWIEGFTIDPALMDSFWEVVPGTRGYCAVLDYRRPPPIIKPDASSTTGLDDPMRSPESKGIPRRSSLDMTRLTTFLGFHFLGRRLYHLHFRYEDGPMIEAYEFHAFGDSEWIDFRRLRKLEPGIPKDPWDFAESRGIIVQRWPEPPPPPPFYEAGVIEDVTWDALKPLCEGHDVSLQPTARGMMLSGNDSVKVIIDAAHTLKKPTYILGVYPIQDRLICTIYRDGTHLGRFNNWSPLDRQLDSVLGETTPRGILRALEVPPELVGLEPEASSDA
jgi:hypothetical protein